jgi:hypothetical protein
MIRIVFAFLVAPAFVIALMAQKANADSLNSAAGALKQNAVGSNLMQKIHGCGYSCECGPPRGFGCEQQYHRHLHMLCLPVRCDRGTDCDRTPSEGACRHIAPR